ncbi:MAG: UMP kinase [Ignisphaera sp.]|nr:UMP kinase [Ignisphaera sp.]
MLLKISGKIINPDKPDIVRGYAEVIREITSKAYRVVVVVGGGPYARSYISCSRSIGLNQAQSDMLGIEVSRLNALLLAYAIGDDVYLPIPRGVEDVERAWSTGRTIVLGGLQPGQSTAAVAAIVAEVLGIRKVLYATDVDGIYDRDPRVYGDARKLNVVSADELPRVLSQRFEAGGYELLDPLAISIIKRSCIEVVVFNGMNPHSVYKALEGSVGTRVKPC